MSIAPATPETTPAKVVTPTQQVQRMITGYLTKGTLHLPSDYSPENALKSAWLILQEVQDKNYKPALSVCTSESVVNALLDMVVQGLNPAKKQCYFICYGNRLVCQRSYFGDQALAIRLKPGIEIFSGVVYEKDVFEIGKVRGRTVIEKHTTKIENQDVTKIRAAYCGIVDLSSGEDLGAEVMTMDQIRRSWGMSKTYKAEGEGTHNKFPDQMALRTVIRRRCKGIINASNDALLLESVQRQEIEDAEFTADEEAAEHANGEVITMGAPLAPPAGIQSEDKGFESMSESDLKAKLKLNGDQWDHIVDALVDKTDLTAEEFLTQCVSGGCTDYKSVAKKLDAIPEPTLTWEEPGF